MGWVDLLSNGAPPTRALRARVELRYKFVNFPGVNCLMLVNHIVISVLPRRVWFLRRFGLKTVIDFVRFGLQSGMVRGNYGIECMSAFVVSIPNE